MAETSASSEIVPERCGARIRPMVPINSTELRCERPDAHVESTHTLDRLHVSTLRDHAYPGSATVVSWLDDDRRNFTGEWVECPVQPCTLPANHRGNHAP